MLVTERSGQLRLVSADGELDPEPITGLPQIYAIGIAGLMDIALHPEFASNRLIYLSYSKPDPEQPQNATLAVLQARWDGGPVLADVKDVFVADAWYGAPPVPAKCCGQGPAFGSFGGRILFGRDGKLFVTSGDRNFGEMVQDTSNHFGKILRLNADGTAPRDNPWVGREGHKPEVWSTGHRNPLGLTIDPATGSMWESEFGPRGGDEVNRIERGSNYGWILVTQGNHYDGTPAGGVKDVAGYEDPVMAFGPPSLNPGNLAVYRGARFRQWDGDLLLASFTQGLLRFDVDGEGRLGEPEQLLQDLGQRWRDVRVGPDGDVWMLTDQDDGALIRISPR
jgi:glucose/arabinose dehydrogenase